MIKTRNRKRTGAGPLDIAVTTAYSLLLILCLGFTVTSKQIVHIHTYIDTYIHMYTSSSKDNPPLHLYRHCEYHSLSTVHTHGDTHLVGPGQLRPPHCSHLLAAAPVGAAEEEVDVRVLVLLVTRVVDVAETRVDVTGDDEDVRVDVTTPVAAAASRLETLVQAGLRL